MTPGEDGQGSSPAEPFAETKELIAGFFLVEMTSLEECVEWFKRCPMCRRLRVTG